MIKTQNDNPFLKYVLDNKDEFKKGVFISNIMPHFPLHGPKSIGLIMKQFCDSKRKINPISGRKETLYFINEELMEEIEKEQLAEENEEEPILKYITDNINRFKKGLFRSKIENEIGNDKAFKYIESLNIFELSSVLLLFVLFVI